MTTDPRTRRTVAALREALRGLLVDRDLDSITVSEVCRVAGVRRTSFYTHHQGVGELLTAMLVEEMDQPLALPDTSQMSIPQLAEHFQETLVDAFRVITRDRAQFRAAFASSTSSHLRDALEANFARRLEIALVEWRGHGTALEVFDPVAVPFAAAGLAGSVQAWALSDRDDPVAWAESIRDQMPPWWPRPTAS
ncbi:TetR/AcrR family transcriptional regulator [Aeromicrobium stalagmiti]|uniref:TetR/AcrR family transcriptional regulator n=1 Tax=Aeromicrobium stalagmiti TaxID=2738988 RepID=UPI0015697A6E|nr:TetR/AcrR family transcriptional regulator [Aeromicrobium stalagmiti]NRQ49978.1 TetR/AcrR family transcriptional regulator [Aeromicrobium stalagmiti]